MRARRKRWQVWADRACYALGVVFCFLAGYALYLGAWWAAFCGLAGFVLIVIAARMDWVTPEEPQRWRPGEETRMEFVERIRREAERESEVMGAHRETGPPSYTIGRYGSEFRWTPERGMERKAPGSETWELVEDPDLPLEDWYMIGEGFDPEDPETHDQVVRGRVEPWRDEDNAQ